MIAEEIGKIDGKKKAETQVLPGSPDSVKFQISASPVKAIDDQSSSQSKRTVDLTINEIQALSDLARGSSVMFMLLCFH